MSQIVGTNTVTFNEDKLNAEGISNVKSLHIPVECKRMIISRVLIDNGFALNVFPVMTLNSIGIDDSFIRPNGMMVQAFDGTKTLAYGEIDLKVLIVFTNLKYPLCY